MEITNSLHRFIIMKNDKYYILKLIVTQNTLDKTFHINYSCEHSKNEDGDEQLEILFYCHDPMLQYIVDNNDCKLNKIISVLD